MAELSAGRSALLKGLEPTESSIKQCFREIGSHSLQGFEVHHRSSFPEGEHNSLPRYLALIFLGLIPFQWRLESSGITLAQERGFRLTALLLLNDKEAKIFCLFHLFQKYLIQNWQKSTGSFSMDFSRCWIITSLGTGALRLFTNHFLTTDKGTANVWIYGKSPHQP